MNVTYTLPAMNDTASVIAALIVLLVVLIINIILGCQTKKMNAAKGIPGGFWWGFFLGVAGVIVVALRPYHPNMYK